jgi:predicted metal-dependent peptidase
MDATTLNDGDVIIYSQAAEVFAACSAIMMLINSSAATNKTLRMLYCILQHSLKLKCSLEDDSKRLKTKKKTKALRSDKNMEMYQVLKRLVFKPCVSLCI